MILDLLGDGDDGRRLVDVERVVHPDGLGIVGTDAQEKDVGVSAV